METQPELWCNSLKCKTHHKRPPLDNPPQKKSSDIQMHLKWKSKFLFTAWKSLQDLPAPQTSALRYCHSVPWDHYPLVTLPFLFSEGGIVLAIVSVGDELYLMFGELVPAHHSNFTSISLQQRSFSWLTCLKISCLTYLYRYHLSYPASCPWGLCFCLSAYHPILSILILHLIWSLNNIGRH